MRTAVLEKKSIKTKLDSSSKILKNNVVEILPFVIKDIKLALQLAKKALNKDPKYVNYDYRKEQLWGEKLQASTEILLQNEQLKKDVILAKSKIIESS